MYTTTIRLGFARRAVFKRGRRAAPRAEPRGVLHFKDSPYCSQIFLRFKIIRTAFFYELPKLISMMKFSGMRELMDDEILNNIVGCEQHLDIEIQRTINGTASPF